MRSGLRWYWVFLLGKSIWLFLIQKGFSQYCLPTYSFGCSSGDYIDDVVFNTINNTGTGCTGTSPNNYTYYSSISTNVVIGQTYSILLRPGPSWTQNFGVWIDYNKDGDFDDPGEFVFWTTSKVSASNPATGNITIPATALPGTTRMRVRCTFSSVPFTSTGSCSNQSYGETEDYNVVIVAPSPTDVGIVALLQPKSGCDLDNNVSIQVTIQNFGTSPQTGFNVAYQINNGTPVVENIGSVTVPPSGSYNYTFSTPANFPHTWNIHN